MNMMQTKQLNVRVSPRLLERINQASKQQGIAVSELIRRAIDDYLNYKNGNSPAVWSGSYGKN
jgi:predicted HicB family RNase H-like nuclease